MANDATPSAFYNPVMLWTDMGLRALEQSVASSQKMSDAVDRVTRTDAAADVEPQPARVNAFALASQLHRSGFELVTQGWLHWMSTLGNIAAVAAGARAESPQALSFAMPRPPALESRRETASGASSGEHAAASSSSDRPGRAARRTARKPRNRER